MNTNQAKELSALIEVISSSTRTNDSLLTELTESLSYMTDFDKDSLNRLDANVIKDIRTVMAPLTDASEKLLAITKNFDSAINPS